MKQIIFAAALLLGASPAVADTQVWKCSFSSGNDSFYTIYDDGTPARIGDGPGIGSKGQVIYDTLTKAFVVIETNISGVPITMTTFAADGSAVHSRHIIGLSGEVIAPSQHKLQCQKQPLPGTQLR